MRWDSAQLLHKCGQNCHQGRIRRLASFRGVHLQTVMSVSQYNQYLFVLMSIWPREYKENQGLLTTRSPCDTTFHSTKEVRVLLPSVWFTREKERENVVMLLRCWERRGEEEEGTTTPEVGRPSNETLLSTNEHGGPAWEGQCRPAVIPGEVMRAWQG